MLPIHATACAAPLTGMIGDEVAVAAGMVLDGPPVPTEMVVGVADDGSATILVITDSDARADDASATIVVSTERMEENAEDRSAMTMDVPVTAGSVL